MASEIRIERHYHPNGQVSWESSFKNGKQICVVKKWHENGILSWKCPLDDDGLEHGIIRQWNKDGNLLGEYRMEHGTGTEKSWFDNGGLKREASSVNGKLCGRFRTWDVGGELESEIYYNMDRKVSRKAYLEACMSDPALPRYLESDESESKQTEAHLKYKKREASVSGLERHKHNEFICKFLCQPNCGEARQWLAGDEGRNIGEMTPKESREFIEEGYKAGATKIIAVEIVDETTNCLIVYLPPSGPKRERVFEWNGETAQKCDFDPYEDWGQNELFAYFS